MPLTSSATRSASARAACSRRSVSRSCWRRSRSLTSRMKPEMKGSPLISIFETVASAGKRVPSLRTNSVS